MADVLRCAGDLLEAENMIQPMVSLAWHIQNSRFWRWENVLLNESFEFDTENPFVGSSATITRTLQKRVTYKYVKHCLDFSFVFSAPLPAEETCFQQAGSFAVEGTSPCCTGIF
jgi:hypothetical protein